MKKLISRLLLICFIITTLPAQTIADTIDIYNVSDKVKKVYEQSKDNDDNTKIEEEVNNTTTSSAIKIAVDKEIEGSTTDGAINIPSTEKNMNTNVEDSDDVLISETDTEVTTGQAIDISDLDGNIQKVPLETTTSSSISITNSTTAAAIQIAFKDGDPETINHISELCISIGLNDDQIKSLASTYSSEVDMLNKLKKYDSLIKIYIEDKEMLVKLLLKNVDAYEVENNLVISGALKISLEKLYSIIESDKSEENSLVQEKDTEILNNLIEEFGLNEKIWTCLSLELNKTIEDIAAQIKKYKSEIEEFDSKLLMWVNEEVVIKLKEKRFGKEICLEIAEKCNNMFFRNEQIIQLLEFFNDGKFLIESLNEYDSSRHTYPLEKSKIIKELFIKGITLKQIEKGLFLYKALDVSLEVLFQEYDRSEYYNNKFIDEQGKLTLKNLAEKYKIKEEVFIYLTSLFEKNIKEIVAQINKYEDNPNLESSVYVYDEKKWVYASEVGSGDLYYLMRTDSLKRYSEVSEEIIKEAEELCSIERNDLSELESKGCSLVQSINIVALERNFSFSIDELIELYRQYSNYLILEYEIIEYSSFISQNNLLNAEMTKVKQLLLSGIGMEKIRKAYNSQLKNGFSEETSGKSVKRSLHMDLNELCRSSNNDKVEFQKYINPKFSVLNNHNESIAPVSGCLTYENTLLTVPGRNNADLNLVLRYSSDNCAATVPTFDTFNNENERGHKGYDYLQFVLGDGWSFNLSYFETYGDSYDLPGHQRLLAHKYKEPEYLHLSDGRVLKLKRINDTKYEFEDESIIDLKFEVCTYDEGDEVQYNNGQRFDVDRYIEGKWFPFPTYKLVHKNGTIEYFNYDGKLLGVKDKNGSGYNVEYTVYKTGDWEDIYPCKITNSLGDSIKIKITRGVGYPNEIEYGNEKIIIYKKWLDKSAVLDRIERINKENPSEKEITKFEYECKKGKFDFIEKNHHIFAEYNYFALLKEINYPTGALSEYEYESDDIDAGAGYITKFKVYDQKSKYKNKEYNHQRYQYHRRNTEVIKNQNKTIYYYDEYGDNEDILMESKKEYVKDKLVSQEEYEYDDNKLITKSTKKVYNTEGDNYLEYEETMKYDIVGNMIEYTDVMGTTSEYTYDTSAFNNNANDDDDDNNKFNMLKSEKIPIDDKRTREISYELDKYNKNVAKKVLSNGDENVNINYEYNSDGELKDIVIEKKDGKRVRTHSYSRDSYRSDESTSTFKAEWREATIYKYEDTLDYNPETNDYDIKDIRKEIYYNPLTGDVIEYKDENGNITQYEYDYRSRLVKQINPDGTFKKIIYDDENNIITSIDESGFKRRVIYDGFGNILRKESFENNVWSLKQENIYDSLLRLYQTKDDNGTATTYSYDDFDRIIKITYADGTNVQYTYDDVNNTKTTINEEGHWTKEYYDKLGRVIKQETNDGSKTYTVINEYDYIGNLTKVIDANGNETKYEYDDLGRPIKVIDAEGQETEYEYDELDLLTKITTKEYDDSKNVIKEYTKRKEYDQLGRVIKSIDETNKISLFKYDGNGNLVWTKDKKGQVQTYQYNNLNQLIKHDFGTGSTDYNYDSVGRIKKVTENKDGAEETTYNYYDDGKLKSETLPDGKAISYKYDAVGNIKEINDYFGSITSYNYDLRDRIKNINFGSKVFTYDYYKDGMIKSVQYPNNNLKVQYQYDNINRIKSLNNVNQNSTISAYSYKMDGKSNILEKNDNGNVFSYNYDKLDRLKRLSNTKQSLEHSYQYDVRGNIKKEQANYNIYPEMKTGQYNWNTLGQVINFTNENGQVYNYRYNYKGLRNKKITTNETMKFYYNASGNIIGEEKGSTRTQYIIGHQPLAKVVNGAYYYYFYNGHGDVVQITDESGNVVNRYKYDEWGKILDKQENIENSITYAGQYYDKESGNYYLRARYYNPVMKRFISRDSYEGQVTNPLTLNLYSYCLNNPLKFSDPSGNFPELSEIIHSLDESVNNMLESLSSVVRDKTDYKNFSVNTADIGGFFLDMNEEDEVYHANFDCWQQYFGYNDAYDLAFDCGTSMERAKFQFEYKEKDIILWAWKGDYVNLGAGAELGIYKNLKVYGISTPQWIVDKENLTLPMSMTLKDNGGNTIVDNYSPKGSQWWITGFNPNFKDVQASSLTATFKVNFSGKKDMYDAFIKSKDYLENKGKWSTSQNNKYLLTFTF